MRTFTVLLVLLSCAAVAAPSGGVKPVVAVLPPAASTDEVQQLGLLMQARAFALVGQAGTARQVHVKQVFAMARSEGLAPAALGDAKVAEQARVALGADRVVFSKLEKSDKGYQLTGAVSDGKKSSPLSAKLSSASGEALVAGSAALATAVLALDKATLPKGGAQPESKSADALAAVLRHRHSPDPRHRGALGHRGRAAGRGRRRVWQGREGRPCAQLRVGDAGARPGPRR